MDAVFWVKSKKKAEKDPESKKTKRKRKGGFVDNVDLFKKDQYKYKKNRRVKTYLFKCGDMWKWI